MTSGETEPRRAVGRKFRPRRVSLANDETLVLKADGSIEHHDREGTPTRTWAPDDPEWPRQALRFGLHEGRPTATPSGRDVPGTRPPRW